MRTISLSAAQRAYDHAENPAYDGPEPCEGFPCRDENCPHCESAARQRDEMERDAMKLHRHRVACGASNPFQCLLEIAAQKIWELEAKGRE